jgi:hypothetical protein
VPHAAPSRWKAEVPGSVTGDLPGCSWQETGSLLRWRAGGGAAGTGQVCTTHCYKGKETKRIETEWRIYAVGSTEMAN